MAILQAYNETQKLDKIELFYDEKIGEWFFKMEYICENEAEVFRITYPKVFSGIPTNRCYINQSLSMFQKRDLITLQFNCEEDHQLCPDEKGNIMYREVIEKKTHEMTLEQIEEELGYKVKIVSKKEDKTNGCRKERSKCINR